MIFEISEGAATGIGGIRFIGNNRFGADELRKVILTRETRWWRFLSTEDNYDPDRVNIDREYLRRYYLRNGFADFRVISATAELSPDRRYFYLTYSIEEGERYRIGKVSLTSQIPKINPSDLQGKLLTVEGDWYDNSKVDKSISGMTNLMGDRGYAFANIEPRIKKNTANYSLDLSFTVKESPKVYIERINIQGNVRTLDSVIRREFRLAEGDAFNTTRVQRSEQRIRNLGFFAAAEVTSAPGSSPDRSILNARVQEQGTGQVNFGLGYSSADGFLGQISLGERNLLGRGYAMNISATIAQLRQNYDISFTDPYFLNRQLSATVQVFNTLTNSQSTSQYNEKSNGGSLGFGFAYSERLSHSVRYLYRVDDITNVQATASSFIQQQKGKATISLIGHDLGLWIFLIIVWSQTMVSSFRSAMILPDWAVPSIRCAAVCARPSITVRSVAGSLPCTGRSAISTAPGISRCESATGIFWAAIISAALLRAAPGRATSALGTRWAAIATGLARRNSSCRSGCRRSLA